MLQRAFYIRPELKICMRHHCQFFACSMVVLTEDLSFVEIHGKCIKSTHRVSRNHNQMDSKGISMNGEKIPKRST